MSNVIEVCKTGKFSAICACTRCGDSYAVNFIYGARKSRVGDLCEKCKRVLIDMNPITQQGLIEVFDYNPETGDLVHKLETLRAVAGQSALISHNQGYLSVSVGGKLHLAHRVIWFRQTGTWPTYIDHINHNRSDNRWCNLREVSALENVKNCSLSKNNSIGIQGVRKLPSGKYQAYIMVNRKQINLGCFANQEDAAIARKQGEITYNFHPNHGLKGQE